MLGYRYRRKGTLVGRAIGRSSIGTIPGNNRQLSLPAMPYEPYAVSKPAAAVATAAATPIARMLTRWNNDPPNQLQQTKAESAEKSVRAGSWLAIQTACR
jgi:hypothetical protein